MLIGHLSDFHLFAKTPDSPLVRADIADVLRRIFADVAAFTPAIDVVALTGDLTDWRLRGGLCLAARVARAAVGTGPCHTRQS